MEHTEHTWHQHGGWGQEARPPTWILFGSPAVVLERGREGHRHATEVVLQVVDTSVRCAGHWGEVEAVGTGVTCRAEWEGVNTRGI